MNMFRSLINPIYAKNHPAGKLTHRRYKLRWDWHLRVILQCMIYPLGTWIACEGATWYFQEDIDKFAAEVRAKEEAAKKEITEPVHTLSEKVNERFEKMKLQLEVLHERLEEQSRKYDETLNELKKKESGLSASSVDKDVTEAQEERHGRAGGPVT